MNLILLLFNICAAALAGCAWLSPDFLDRWGLRMRARAIALRRSDATYRKTFDAAMGRRPAAARVAVMAPPQRVWRVPQLRSMAKLVLSSLFAIVIAAGIVALMEMPQ